MDGFLIGRIIGIILTSFLLRKLFSFINSVKTKEPVNNPLKIRSEDFFIILLLIILIVLVISFIFYLFTATPNI